MKRVRALLMAPCLLAATAAFAQEPYIPTGSRVGRPAPATLSTSTHLSDDDRAMRVVNAYAECLVDYDAKKLRPMLSLKPRALTETERKVLTQSRCLSGGDLTMPMQIVRGAIFRSFFFEDFQDEELIFAPEAVNYFEYVQPDQNTAWSIASMLDFAGCVVRDVPARSIDFISSIPGEPAEATALNTLMPHLGPCMHEGLEIEFSKAMLRSYLSEALYWESLAGRTAKATSETRE